MNDSRKKMLERVRAIMAKTMANGCTEGEAMAALEKARELMAAYDISEADLGQTQAQEGATIVATGADDPYNIKDRLATGIAKFTRCKVWRNSRTGVTFCGLESEAAFAQWLLETLQAFVLRELKAHQATRKSQGMPNPRIISSSFVWGCAARIYKRLCELAPQEPATTAGNALVVSRNALIDAAMAASGITIGTRRKTRIRVDHAAYGAGMAAGNAARFDRPMGHGGTLRLT